MSRAANLLKQVEARGAVVMLGGPTGAWIASTSAVADLFPELRQRRAGIVRELRRRDARRWRAEFLELGGRLGYPRVTNEHVGTAQPSRPTRLAGARRGCPPMKHLLSVATELLDGSHTTGVFVPGAWNRKKIERTVVGLSDELEGRTN
jgi:hypothetical protein